jgi:hypothetical protein
MSNHRPTERRRKVQRRDLHRRGRCRGTRNGRKTRGNGAMINHHPTERLQGTHEEARVGVTLARVERLGKACCEHWSQAMEFSTYQFKI